MFVPVMLEMDLDEKMQEIVAERPGGLFGMVVAQEEGLFSTRLYYQYFED